MSSHSSSVARLQQFLIVVLILAIGVWVAWAWPRSPIAAILVAVAMAFGHAWVLAFEFAISPFFSRGDPAPRASASDRMCAWIKETAVAWIVFSWRQPFRWNQVPDCIEGSRTEGRTGVVFVHGFMCNRGFWTPWCEELERQGRAFMAVNLEPVYGAIDEYAPILEDAVQRVAAATGRPPVLICHSMGGLAARAWLQTARAGVAHLVTIATPHAGTWMARFSHLPNGVQMRQGSEWLRELCEPSTNDCAVTCWYSNCDNIVVPPSAATLPAAHNRMIRGAGHVDLAFRPEVMRETLALLD